MKISILADNKNIVKGYGIIENEVNPFKKGIEIETDLNLENIELVDNYKLIDNILVELTEEEKKSLIVIQKTELEILKETVDILVLGSLGV